MNARRAPEPVKWRAARGTRRERDRILIVTEGSVTEPQYFQGLAKHYKATGVEVCGLKVVGDGRGDPLKVVERANQESENGRLLGRRTGYSSIWCVMDVDTHANLEEAVREAKRRRYNLAISNPCFELWLVWHYADHNAYISTSHAVKKCSDFGIKKKRIPFGFPYENVGEAIRRSKCLTAEPPENPGSQVWRVAKVIAQI
ncbi:RloB family protein [Amycolatopsis sp. NPDC003731]